MERPCPICRKPLASPAERSEAQMKAFPLCSARCRAIDLGRWLSESYRIAGEPVEREQSVLGELDDTDENARDDRHADDE